MTPMAVFYSYRHVSQALQTVKVPPMNYCQPPGLASPSSCMATKSRIWQKINMDTARNLYPQSYRYVNLGYRWQISLISSMSIE